MSDELFWLYSDNYRTYNVHVARRLKSVTAAIMLGELASRFRYHRNRNELLIDEKGDGWFYYTHEDVEERTVLTRKNQDTAIEVLLQFKLIEKKTSGLPARRYFKLNAENISSFFNQTENTSLPETDKQDCPETRDKPVCPERANCDDRNGQTAHNIYKHKEGPYRERGVCTPATPALAESLDPSLQKKERAPFVLLSDVDHQKLIDKLGPDVTAACYKILSEWKEDSPKSKWKKCDYRSILRWVVDRYREDKAKAAKAPAEIDTPEENKAHAQHIADNFNPVRCPDRGYRIDVLSKHMEIIPIRNPNARSICISYSEKGFKEQVESAMRKCGLY